MAVSLVVAIEGTYVSDPEWEVEITSANVASGDAIFLFNTNGESTDDPTVADDSGDSAAWTKMGSETLNGTGWWKRVSGGNWGASTVTISVTGNTTTWAGGVLVMRGGQSSGDPFENLSFESNVSGNETHAGFTPSFADSYLVGVIYNFPLGATTATQAFGANACTEQWDSAGSGVRCSASTLLQVGGPTATGDFTWTQGNRATVSLVFEIPEDQGGGGGGSILLLTHSEMADMRGMGG